MSIDKEELSGTILVPINENQRIALINMINESYNSNLLFQRKFKIIESKLEHINAINEVWNEFPPLNSHDALEYAQLSELRAKLLTDYDYWGTLARQSNETYENLQPILKYIDYET